MTSPEITPRPASRPLSRAVWLVLFGPFYLLWLLARPLFRQTRTASDTRKDKS